MATLCSSRPLHVALRTYSLALSLSLGPALLPFITSAKTRSYGVQYLLKVLRRELAVTGFAFSMTVGVAGGCAIRQLWDMSAKYDPECTQSSSASILVRIVNRLRTWMCALQGPHRTFIANLVSASLAIALLHANHRPSHLRVTRAPIPLTAPLPDSAGPSRHADGKPSPTLDLTLLIFVRAVDCLVRSVLLRYTEGCSADNTEEKAKRRKRRRLLTTQLDALVFWASSARIMWCFFYEPERLPRSYNTWIMSMANIDPRILAILRAIRARRFDYVAGVSVPPDLASSLACDLGFPAAWGDPARLPAYGGPEATRIWRELGVRGRDGVGGVPCELLHGAPGKLSCTAHTARRGADAFLRALALYLPVHVLPILLTRPHMLVQREPLLAMLRGLLRSASFLAAFVASTWGAICLTRTKLPRALPRVAQNTWDGPHGCALAGSLAGGTAIALEQGRRRGEMALYVLPRAVRAVLPAGGLWGWRVAEELAFVLSLAALLTAGVHFPASLRGLSRWTVAFVLKGPHAGFWRRRPDSTPDAAKSKDV